MTVYSTVMFLLAYTMFYASYTESAKNQMSPSHMDRAADVVEAFALMVPQCFCGHWLKGRPTFRRGSLLPSAGVGGSQEAAGLGLVLRGFHCG